MDRHSDLAYQILSHSPVAMYCNVHLLNKDIEWFRANNYSVYDLDMKNWTMGSAHIELKNALHFPDYYGENMAAFNDCLSDMLSPDNNGVVLALRNFDVYYKTDKDFSLDLLDVVAVQSRKWLLDGNRLIAIIQSGDPHLYLEKIGGISPVWNHKEWFDKDRIVDR